MSGAKTLRLATGLAAMVAWATSAMAQAQKESPPVLVTADELQYDQDLGLTVAKGHVELSQNDQILLADTVTYNQRTDTVTASGHVSLVQPSGDVAFADFMELRDNFHDGFIKDIRLLLSDRSRMAGNSARRVAGTRTEIRRGVYSPCELCASDPTRPPVWQLRAEQVVDDKELQLVEYRDAVMEVEGVPVFYTPYLSMPDPSVKRASGFLAPIFGNDSSNGVRFGVPYYFTLGPDKDLTFRPEFTSKGGTVLDGQYRQRFSNGYLNTDTSVTIDSTAIDPRSNLQSNGPRGHLYADGLWDINDRWRVGLNGEATTDQTYLQRYHFPYTTNYLTDHLYAENFGATSYANISAYAFQNLDPTFSIANQPFVLPVATYTLTTPTDSLGGRWQFDANALNLLKRDTLEERRLSAGASWRLPFNGLIGDRLQFMASVRGDEYNNDVTPNVGFPQDANKTAGRIFPQVSLNWRYPLIRPGETITTLIEPIAAVFAAPIGGNPMNIVNEDAQSFELDDTDLFRPERFPGLDRVDSGQRVDYGLHAGVFNPTSGSAQALVGQSYRFQKESPFPAATGLDNQRSDVVGRVQISPGNGYFDLFYRARLDGQNLAMRRQEVGITGGPANLHGSISYLATSAIPGVSATPATRQISTGISFQLTSNWSGQVTHTQDLNNGQSSLNSGIQLTYRDDCIAVTGALQRSGITVGDLRPGTSFILIFVFRNLGEFGFRPFG